MNEQLRQNKQAIRAFLQTEVWDEEKLCALLAHAQDKLAYSSCCCLIGVVTARHALQPKIIIQMMSDGGISPSGTEHLVEARRLPLALEAERAFLSLGDRWIHPGDDELRRRLVRPIIRAILKKMAKKIQPEQLRECSVF